MGCDSNKNLKQIALALGLGDGHWVGLEETVSRSLVDLEAAVVRTGREMRLCDWKQKPREAVVCGGGKLVSTMICGDVEMRNILNGLNDTTKENSWRSVGRATWLLLYAFDQMQMEKDKLKNKLFGL